MTPLSLTLRNFGSFRAEQTFIFPEGPGLYFMCGDNQAEPRLEGNAAGKSTVWQALTWLFFGKLANGLKAGDISNWAVGKQTLVRLRYSMWGIELEVERTWSPNTWVLIAPNGHRTDLVKDPTNSCLEELKLDFAPFLQSIVMPQDQSLFLELKGDKQAELFSDVMGLDRWIRSSTRASERARVEDAECRRLERELAYTTGRREAAETIDVEDQLQNWEGDRRRRLDSIAADHKQLVGESKAKGIDLEKRIGEAERMRSAYRQALEVAEASEDTLKALRASMVEVDKEITTLVVNLDGLDHQFHLLNNDVCPTCGHALDKKDPHPKLRAEIKLLSDHLDGKRDVKDQLTRNIASIEQKTMLPNSRTLRDELRSVDDANNRVKGTRREREQIEKELDKLEEAAANLEDAVNPYIKMRADADADVSRHQADEQRLRYLLDDALQRFSLAGSWVRWFKEIRLAQIGEVLEQLEIEVNNQVTALGLVDWELRFDVDRENKSGTIQRGFAVTVLSPNNTKPVPWESWSGGETQRLIDAGQMGLSNLVRARTGTLLALEVWDEPTKGMSPQGVQDLLEALYQRAQREKLQIWVVDHRTLGFNKFKGTAKVVKTEQGSHFDLSGL